MREIREKSPQNSIQIRYIFGSFAINWISKLDAGSAGVRRGGRFFKYFKIIYLTLNFFQYFLGKVFWES